MSITRGNLTVFGTAGVDPTFDHNNDGNYLVVCCSNRAAVDTIGVTYNGVSMNEIITVAGGNSDSWYFGLANPASGVNEIIVDTDGTRTEVIAQSFSGVDTADPEGSIGSDGGPNITSVSISLIALAVLLGFVLFAKAFPSVILSGSRPTTPTDQPQTPTETPTELRPPQTSERPALEMMEQVFVGNHTQAQIKERLDRAMELYGEARTEENYLKYGSVLVRLRKEISGATEMNILACVIGAHVPEMTTLPELHKIMAVCAATLAKCAWPTELVRSACPIFPASPTQECWKCR